jgi:hypothetical protein
MASVADSATQEVTVIDGFGEVILSLGASPFPAGFTPGQARLLAAQIKDSADRVGEIQKAKT